MSAQGPSVGRAATIKKGAGPCLATAMALMVGLHASALADPPEHTTLPVYQPTLEVSGVLRSRGNEHMAALLGNWQAWFRKYHPKVQFDDSLKGSASGMYGLEMRTADLALMGRPINPYERYGIYERSWVFPVEIEVATGSAAASHKSPAYAILVHGDNPLTQITLAQLDGVFGGQREGGWDALSWDEQAARGIEGNIRSWGQLGLTGAWADQPIRVYGPPLLGAGAVTWFQTRVLKGGAMWNQDLREYRDREAMVADLAADPYGIAYAALGHVAGGVKPVAVAESNTGPYVELSPRSVGDRSYPLARPVYIVYPIDDEQAGFSDPRGDPRVKEFLRYVLSRQGQQEVAREGSYLPLPPGVVNAQLQKIEARGTPPERELLSQ